jgi:alanine-synthesizing transaminase
VRYLNIGDPVAFGFKTPPHLVAAVERAMRDSHNNYGPSAGIPAAREAVAAEYTANGFPVAADRVFITAGTSEGIELTLNAVVDAAAKCWCRCDTRCTRPYSRSSTPRPSTTGSIRRMAGCRTSRI